MPASTDKGHSDASSSVKSIGSSSGKREKKRTLPICNKCKNHGLSKKLKGHKRYCQHIDCKCIKCSLTEQRRRVMAAQTRKTRAQKEDEDLKIPVEQRASILPTVKKPKSLKVPISSEILESSALLKDIRHKKPLAEEVRYLKEEAWKLIEEFGGDKSVLHFAYFILKKAGSFKKGKKMLLDAQKSIVNRGVNNAQLTMNRPTILTHTRNYSPTTTAGPFPPSWLNNYKAYKSNKLDTSLSSKTRVTA